MSKIDFSYIEKGVYTELGSTCTMLGVMKLSNSVYSRQNSIKPFNRFVELGKFIDGVGGSRKVVIKYLNENTFYKDNGFIINVDEDNELAPNIENNFTENNRTVMFVDNDYKITDKCLFGDLEEIIPTNTRSKFIFMNTKETESGIEYNRYYIKGNMIPLDKEIFNFKESVLINKHSSKEYNFKSMCSFNKGLFIKNDVDITSVRNPGNDCFLSRFLLPNQTEGNLIGMNQYNLICNKRELELQKIYYKEMGVSSLVLVNGEEIENKSNPYEYEDYIKDMLNKVDLPYILLEDENTTEFRKQLRNLDRGRMIFHLHLDNADKTTGISYSDYLYKDQSNLPSVVRPLVISDILIESLINNLDLQDYILFTIKDLELAGGKITEGKSTLFYKYINHKLDTVELYKEFGVKIVDETSLVESCANLIYPYILNSSYNSEKIRNYYKVVNEGLICKSKLLYWSNRHNNLVKHMNAEDFVKVHKSIKKYLTPIKELERIIKYRMLDSILSNGISYFISNLDNPTNLLEYILSSLNNKIIVIDFIKLNLDDKYEDTFKGNISSKLRKYYSNISSDDKEKMFLKENIKPTMVASKEAFFNFNNDNVLLSRFRPLGGTLNGFMEKQNVNNMLELDGYYCSVNDKNEGGSTSVFKSVNYFRTTYIDTKESGIDSNKIMYEEKLGILFCKCDRGVIKYFLEINNPRIEDRSKYSNGEFFQYYGQGPTLYRVSNGHVFTMVPMVSNSKDGLYRTVYENGNVIVKEEYIPLDNLSEYNISTSYAIASSIGKLQNEMKGRTKIENDDIMHVNKLQLQILNIKEKILSHEIFRKEHEVKLIYTLCNKQLDLENELLKFKVNMSNSILNMHSRYVDNKIKEIDYYNKVESNRLINEDNLNYNREKNGLSLLTTGFKVLESTVTFGGKLLKTL